MQINPEILRNYWHQFSGHRIIMMPAIILVLVYLAYSSSQFSVLNETSVPFMTAVAMAFVCFCFITFIWGSYSAAGAVVGQINDRTWDYQRLSSITPWSLSWGTVFGSTLYVWYGAFISLVLGAFFASFFLSASLIIESVFTLLIIAFFNIFFVSLIGLQALQTNDRSGVRRSIGYRILGLIIGFMMLGFARTLIPYQEITASLATSDFHQFEAHSGITLYGFAMNARSFLLLSIGFFMLWSLFGIYRTMRTELKMKSVPWGWAVFLVFLILFYGGYSDQSSNVAFFPYLLVSLGSKLPVGVLDLHHFVVMAFIICVVSCYLMFLSDNISITRYRMMAHRLDIGQQSRAAELIPRLAVSYVFALIAGVAVIVLGPKISINNTSIHSGFAVLGFFLFMLRDIALLHYFSIANDNKRAVFATAFYLAVLYILIPWFVSGVFQVFPGSLFYPIYVSSIIELLPALIQAVVALGLLYDRWKQGATPIKRQTSKA